VAERPWESESPLSHRSDLWFLALSYLGQTAQNARLLTFAHRRVGGACRQYSEDCGTVGSLEMLIQLRGLSQGSPFEDCRRAPDRWRLYRGGE
jgi:hypothetical protein